MPRGCPGRDPPRTSWSSAAAAGRRASRGTSRKRGRSSSSWNATTSARARPATRGLSSAATTSTPSVSASRTRAGSSSRRSPATRGGARDSSAPALNRLLAAQRAHGVAAKILTVDELQSLEPGIDATDLAVGVYDEHAGYADPVATSLGFARAGGDYGAEVREGAEGLEILTAKRRAVGVRTDSATILADRVVVAAGDWSPRLLATAGGRVPLRVVPGGLPFPPRA